MNTQNDFVTTHPDGHYRTGSAEPETAARRASETPRRTETAEIQTGGTSLELVGGGGAVVLGILGLVGVYPAAFAEIAAIAAGGGLLAHGIATTLRWRDAYRRAGDDTVVAAGIGSEAVGGAAGAALGILALIGVVLMVLMPVSAIVLGAALLFAAPAQPELVGDASSRRVVQVARAGGGIEGIAGVGAIVLGILALLDIGPRLTLTLVSMLGIGGGLLLAGGALAGIFTRRALHPQHS
jgi:hypothetical protein